MTLRERLLAKRGVMEHALTFRLDARQYSRLLWGMIGPWEPVKSAEEMRWDDDGGPAFPDPVRYTHIIKAA